MMMALSSPQQLSPPRDLPDVLEHLPSRSGQRSSAQHLGEGLIHFISDLKSPCSQPLQFCSTLKMPGSWSRLIANGITWGGGTWYREKVFSR